ncbi:MAG: hypothetical protein AB9903_26630 [Vulcanimicrobiota bacterium]
MKVTRNIEVNIDNARKAIRGVAEIRTPLKSKMLTRPKAKNAEYLSLYLLNKEKDRNLQEMRALAKRQNQLSDNIHFIESHTGELLQELTSEENISQETISECIEPRQQKEEIASMPVLSEKWKFLSLDY